MATLKEQKHYTGHRQRVKDRFLDMPNRSNHSDQDILELLLFYTIPRKDVKPLVKELLEHFSSLSNILSCSYEDFKDFTYISESTFILFKLIKSTSMKLIKQEIHKKPILSNWQHLLDYCYANLASEKKEFLKLLYLNTKYVLIKDEILQEGTVDYAPVYPREIVKRVLEVGASAFILLHNHPSGDPTPSDADIAVTKKLLHATKALDITLLDHLIVGKKGIISLKNIGLLY